MKRSLLCPTHPVTAAAICVAGILTVGSVNLQAKDIQVGRYSTLTTMPSPAQVDLLETTLNLRFPERIQTVGEATRYLLQRSGYRLVSEDVMAPETAALFTLPLPAVHRRLGPMTLREALVTLAGPAFLLVQDLAHRLVTFERCSNTRTTGSDTVGAIEEGGAKDDH